MACAADVCGASGARGEGLAALPFPSRPPARYAAMLDDEPRFDPTVHLAFRAPAFASVLSLGELGYDGARSSKFALSLEPFRLLSDAGVAALQLVCEKLKAFKFVGEDNRNASYVAGAGYRSSFIRALTRDPTVLSYFSEVAGVRLAPCTVTDCQAYVNFAPDDVSKVVDSWHVDSTPFTAVLMVTDPRGLKGGELQWFKGTASEAAGMLGLTAETLHLGGTSELPKDRTASVRFPEAGWATLQEGRHVVHRASRLETRAERTTLIFGLVAAEAPADEARSPMNIEYIATWPHPGIHKEVACHAAWDAERRLAALRTSLDPDASAGEAARALREAAAEVQRAIAALEVAEAQEPPTKKAKP